MKVVNLKGRAPRRAALRLPFFALLCLLAVAAGALRFGAGAQVKQQPAGKGPRPGGAKLAPPVGVSQAPGKFKASGPKRAGAAPLVLGCGNATSAITFGQTVNGTLANGDCVSPQDGSLYDAYSFTGSPGQQVVITMSSSAFDTYLYLMRPSETVLTDNTIQNDDMADGDTNSRITVTLDETGTYTILANAFWAPNDPDRDDSGTGAYTLTLAGGTVCSQTETPIAPNSTATGTLSASDCLLDDGSFYDVYTFNGTAGQQVSVTMTASFNTFLFLIAPDGDELARDDNGGGGTNSRIPAGTGLARLPQTGVYRIVANSFSGSTTGTYSLNLTVGASACPSTPISVGQTVNGSLDTTDCRLPADSSFIDVYTFQGTANQTINITLSSTAFDTWLTLLTPAGAVLSEDNNGGGGTNSRIPPSTGSITLAATGTYTIYANSAAAGATGAYQLILQGSQVCTTTLTQASRAVGAGDSPGLSNAFTTQAGCAAPTATSNASWITGVSATVDAAGNGTFTYNVAANTGAARVGTITVGGQTFTVNQAAAVTCVASLYPTVQPFTSAGGAGRFTVFTQAGACAWQATSNVDWITVTQSAPGAGNPNNRVRFTVAANGTGATRTGTITVGTQTFTVTQTSAATTPTLAFTAANTPVGEGDPSLGVVVSVTRSGDTAGAATVDYATVDNTAAVPCDPTIPNPDTGQPFPTGTAYARCDYASTIDTLTFLPGETTKTFRVPLVNDVHVEVAETFQLALSNPQGATLGTQQTATVTINDNDTTASATNPINTHSFFVRQHYLDFLSREPEAGEPWTATLNGCPNPFNVDRSPFSPSNPSADCDRIKVSGAFFGSPEFRLKGLFAFVYHKVSFGSPANPNYVPTYVDFTADSRRVTGATGEEVFAKRNDFAEDWVNRPAFKTRYDALSNAQFVDTLLANVNASLTTADPASGATRDSLVNDLTAGTRTRAEVLRIIVESLEVNQRQTNFAFVAIQYYGYLRRTPEEPGYTNWLNTINAGNGEREMIYGFLYSEEYKRRFGPNTAP